jgi:hypothetical protein
MHLRLFGGFAASAPALAAFAQAAAKLAAPASHCAGRQSPYANTAPDNRPDQDYGTHWGIDGPNVMRTSLGALLRFGGHIVDPKNAVPDLIEPRSHAMLSVPTVERIGSRLDDVVRDFSVNGLTVR